MSEGTTLEERPPCDHEILKALFDTIPRVFAKEEKGFKKEEVDNA